MTPSQSIDFASFDPETQPSGSKCAYYLDVAELPSGDTLRLAALVAKGTEPGPQARGAGWAFTVTSTKALTRCVSHSTPLTPGGWLAPSWVCRSATCLPSPPVRGRARSTGLNLARIFPGDAQGTITERIAYNLSEHVDHRVRFPDRSPQLRRPFCDRAPHRLLPGRRWSGPEVPEGGPCLRNARSVGATRTSALGGRCHTPTRGGSPWLLYRIGGRRMAQPTPRANVLRWGDQRSEAAGSSGGRSRPQVPQRIT